MPKLLLKEAEKRIQKLIYISEMDSFFTVKLYIPENQKKLSIKNFLSEMGFTDQKKIFYEVFPFSSFFDSITKTTRDNQSEEEKKQKEKYKQLQFFLEKNLKNILILKLGESRKKFYLVGETPEQEWLIFSADLLET